MTAHHEDLQQDAPQVPPRARKHLVWTAGGAGLVVGFIVAGAIVTGSGADDMRPNAELDPPVVTTTRKTPTCESEMTSVVTGMLVDWANGYENLDGPSAVRAKGRYGPSSEFFLASASAWGRAMQTYTREGLDAAALVVPGIARTACQSLDTSPAFGK